MVSFKPQTGAFQPAELAILQEAFETVWATIQERRPSQTDNDELRTAVSDKLCQIAATNGVTDATSLARATLVSFAFRA